MAIPEIIHHIAPEDRSRWHPVWHRCFESWKTQFPDHEFRTWNDHTDLDMLIEQEYPQYISVFRSFPHKVMKLNFARFAMLHRYGGIYADMDIYCYRNFHNQLCNNSLFLVENTLSETVNGEFAFEICLMASEKNHAYFADCMENSAQQFGVLAHLFDKPSVDNQWLCMQITDSPLLIQSRNIHNPDQISLLPYHSYNNRAASYDPGYYTKHMRSSAWNRSTVPDRYLIIENLLFAFSSGDASVDKLIQQADHHHIVDIADFDFYHDYTNKRYFTGDPQHDHALKIRTKQLYKQVMNIA